MRDRLAEITSSTAATERELAAATEERDRLSSALTELQTAAGETGTAVERDSAA
nr:hypothetical protein [Actinomycetota bacterium]NIS33921.1 hypothetical protein [Actinomycetota bacterium]NIT97149.1 hypothetical protein [Actinomycetota bacterium]NIU20825.1 hypothetical protein [Actinomycetota bacterium]NIU68729.1 hypothetical protein [Actinomycetota bacterium]